MQASFDTIKNKEFVNKIFDESAVPSLQECIKIPNLSRSYDSEWDSNGLLRKSAEHIKAWIENLTTKGLKTEIIKDQGFSPLIFTQIEGTLPLTLFFFGHFDTDDGYSTYDTMIVIKSCHYQGNTNQRLQIFCKI